jgi:hypothetical protein
MGRVRYWVVEFDCNEAVIREGLSVADVYYPDDLGCLPSRVRPLDDLIKSRKKVRFLWGEHGCLRYKIDDV